MREQLGISRGNSSIAGWLQAVQQEHQAIYDAIAVHDSDAAAKAARAHLRNGMERLRKFHAHQGRQPGRHPPTSGDTGEATSLEETT